MWLQVWHVETRPDESLTFTLAVTSFSWMQLRYNELEFDCIGQSTVLSHGSTRLTCNMEYKIEATNKIEW